MKNLTFVKYSGKTLKQGVFYATVNNLWLKGYGNVQFFQEILTDGDFHEKRYGLCLQESELFIAISPIGGEPIAAVLFMKNRDLQATGRPWVLVSTMVKQKYRRQKVGTRLLRYAKKHSRCKSFYTETSRKDGQAFYQKMKI